MSPDNHAGRIADLALLWRTRHGGCRTLGLSRAGCGRVGGGVRRGGVADGRSPVAAGQVHGPGGAPELAAGPELADPVVAGVEAPCPAAGRAERVERVHGDRGQRGGRPGEREGECPGGGALLDPLDEGVQQVTGGLLGIHGRGAAAEAVVLAGDHVQPGEFLAGFEAAGVAYYGLVVADGAERGDLLVVPSLVHDELPAGLPEG